MAKNKDSEWPEIRFLMIFGPDLEFSGPGVPKFGLPVTKSIGWSLFWPQGTPQGAPEHQKNNFIRNIIKLD